YRTLKYPLKKPKGSLLVDYLFAASLKIFQIRRGAVPKPLRFHFPSPGETLVTEEIIPNTWYFTAVLKSSNGSLYMSKFSYDEVIKGKFDGIVKGKYQPK